MGSLLQPRVSSSPRPRSCCFPLRIRALWIQFYLFLPSLLFLQQGRCLPGGNQMPGLWGALGQHKPSCRSWEEKALHTPNSPLVVSLMSGCMHTVQRAEPSRLEEGAAQTGSVAKYLRALSSVGRPLACSLFCFEECVSGRVL